MTKMIILTLAIILGVGLTVLSTIKSNKEFLVVNSFEECVEKGNPVMESYPRQCRAEDKTFTEEVVENSTIDKIKGTWISVEDENSTIEFIDNQKIDYYSGEKLSEETFGVVDNTRLKVGDMEYEILSISDNNLSLIFIGKGSTLNYKR